MQWNRLLTAPPAPLPTLDSDVEAPGEEEEVSKNDAEVAESPEALGFFGELGLVGIAPKKMR